MKNIFYTLVFTLILFTHGLAQEEKTILQKVRQMITEAIPDSAGLSNTNKRVDTLMQRIDSLLDLVESIEPGQPTGNADSLNNLPATSYMLKSDSSIFASRYYTDAQLLSKSNSNHNHNGIYEPAISKLTGYLKWNGTSWVFSNETYSLTTHNHSGLYEPANSNIQTHIGSTLNPHNVTKTQLGLSNVPNVDATNPANITQSSSYRFVTDAEKIIWNSGSGSGVDSSAARNIAAQVFEDSTANAEISIYSMAETDAGIGLAYTALQTINITYPDANTIQFAAGDALQLDPATLEINGFNQLTVVGGSAFDSTYAYQRIIALEGIVSSLQNLINNILTALDTCGCSASTADNTPPNPPSNFTAIGGTATDQFVSTWTEGGQLGGDLNRILFYAGSSNDTTTFILIDSINAGVLTYTYRDLSPNTTYWCAVKAVDDSGNVSYFSNIDSATTRSIGGTTPLATLDFEEGNLSEWSSTSGSNLSVSTTFAHTGTYSMRVGTNSYGIFNFTADTEVWLTFWLYLPSTSSQNATTNYIAMFNNGIADRTCFGTNNSTWSEWIVGVNSGDLTDDDFTANFSTNTWHKVKIYYKTNGSNLSNHQVWIDDTSIWSATNTFINSVSNFTVGSEAATITNYFYVDDIKFYDTDPGTQN